MKEILLVGLGGCIGAIGRYKIGAWILPLSLNSRFPVSTFAVNIIGCFLIGVLAGLAEKHGAFSLEWRLFLMTGILGGFTTFSAFGYDGLYLLRKGDPVMAITYATATVGVGLLAVWAGLKLVPAAGGV
jgi:fluoride exporter